RHFAGSGVGLLLAGTAYNTNRRIDDGRFHHVVVTRTNAGAVTIFVDGESVFTTTNTTFFLPNGVLMFGQDQDSVGGSLDASQDLEGDIDEVAVFARALGEEEVLRIYAASRCALASCAEHLTATPSATDGL